ncbi:MATE family efflux transporter [Fulvivirga kasyanovii]|uniref:MATE family efflux transporter n=1 Tax=Fulvivirga kasyanovii TaxID=396812 RepID=A0ABW9RTC8_9BACT|nr:MATE family efflux transporter [Fulvivirga kasyanovii]MTI27442.1 MATE family efflux transporter [Fulvivirga kasyanovii]
MENNDEILNGPVIPTSLKLAIPVMIGQILSLVYGIIDLVFVSMIDKDSTSLISGMGLIFPIYMLYLALGIGLFTGVSVLVARAVGERNKFILDKVSSSGILISIVVSVVSALLFYVFGKDVIHALAGTEISDMAMVAATDYLYYILPGLCFLLFNQMMLGIFQGEGQVKHYAASMFLSTVLNIILSPLCIFTFNLGVAGSAVATSISIFVAFLYLLGAFAKKENQVQLNWKVGETKSFIVKEIARIGIAHVACILIINIASMVMNFIIGSISETAMNSWVLVIRMDEFLLFIGYAFGTSTLTMVGQSHGIGNVNRIQEVFKKNIMLVTFMGLICVGIYNLAAPLLFSFFTNVPEVIDGSVLQVRILSLTYIAIIITIVINSTFQATGRAIPGVVLEVIRMLIISIPLSYTAVFVWGASITTVFYIIGGANIFVLAIGMIWSTRYVNKMTKSSASMQHSFTT